MTPIDTDEVSGVMATHGTKLPNRTGIFGGLPGSCARFEIVRGSDALGDLGHGRRIERLDAVDGDYEELPGVNSGLIIKPGEIFNVRLQNGGGYGDPILREPAAVVTDLRTGAVSDDVARQIYGVVAKDGELDAEATASRREEIRAARRAAMSPPGAAGGPPMAISAERWGESLRFTRGEDGGAIAVCAHCEEPLGILAADWRALTGTVAVQAADLGPLVQLPEGLVARQYVCPSCVTALWVEVIPEEGDAWQDFELD
jgi:N-methylhydantoinase B